MFVSAQVNVGKRIAALMLMLLFGSEMTFADDDSVLLVGNSFTGSLYEQILNRDLFTTRWVGGWNLDEHFNDPVTRSTICAKPTFVVLQDFSTRPADPALFEFDMDEMISLVRSCRAVPVLFMTWETNGIDYNTVHDAYVQAGLKHDTQVVPVGTVWNRIRTASESTYQSLLTDDGKHPSARGSQVNVAILNKAFCSTCYQQSNFSRFSISETALIKSILNEEITQVVVPIAKGVASMPAIIDLLLIETRNGM